MKTVPSVKRNYIALFLFLALLLCLLALVAQAIFRLSEADQVEKILLTHREYQKHHSHDETWFITNTPGPAYYEQAADVAWKEGQRLKEMMQFASAASKDAAGLWGKFHDSAFSLQINAGISPELLKTIINPTELDKQGLANNHEVSLIPEDIAKEYFARGIPSALLAWRTDSGVTMAAIDWPDKFITAALYHVFYLGHCYPADRSKSPKFFDPDSSSYAVAEMEAHRIESEVLNYLTQGKYFEKLDGILSRTSSTGKTYDAVAAVTYSDLLELDTLISAKDAGNISSELMYSQYIFALAIRHIDKFGVNHGRRSRFFIWAKENGIMLRN